MAVVVAFRIAIALSPTATRILQAGQPPAGGALLYFSERLHRRLQDPGESDAELSQDASSESDTVVEVTTFSDPFETRKLQMLWGRQSGDAAGEDDAVTTMHFLKLVAGSPVDTWLAADFTTVETAITTMWSAIRGYWYAGITLKELRWYRAGPQRDEELGGPGRTGPPVRVTAVGTPGTRSFLTNMVGLPPQVAVSITEQTTSRKTWGRFYLPQPATSAFVTDSSGRFMTTFLTDVANAVDALYESCRTAGTPVVVYSSAKAERDQAEGPPLPAQVARALTVDQLQVDDVPDVIRSRRWDKPLLKVQRAVSA